MAKRGPRPKYLDEELTYLKVLVQKHRRGGGIADRAWRKRIGPAWRRVAKKHGWPARGWRALKDKYWRMQQERPGETPAPRRSRNGLGAIQRLKKMAERAFAVAERAVTLDGQLKAENASLRFGNRKLQKECRAFRLRAEAAEAAYRRIEQVVGVAKKRAENTMVAHSQD